MEATINKAPTRLIALSDWERHQTWPSIAALRVYVKKEAENGFKAHGVVKRVGRRVLIDEAAFFRWVEAQQGDSKNG